ncbi:MAG TPA: hypothetical protein VFE98_06985 [Candidatus Bathyarchaeia archaeon]|nr:hypothetical protein [Candidatus Bathyarchaeia archaeon]
MKRNTLRFLIWIAVVYVAILLVAKEFLAADSTPGVSLAAIPLVIIAIVIVRDLTSRSSKASKAPSVRLASVKKGEQLRFLSRQIEVTAQASASYFNDVVGARLRGILVDKVSVETGIDKARVRGLLSSEASGPGLLRDQRLYSLLYGSGLLYSLPRTGKNKIRMVREAVMLIEAWKP